MPNKHEEFLNVCVMEYDVDKKEIKTKDKKKKKNKPKKEEQNMDMVDKLEKFSGKVSLIAYFMMQFMLLLIATLLPGALVIWLVDLIAPTWIARIFGVCAGFYCFSLYLDDVVEELKK